MINTCKVILIIALILGITPQKTLADEFGGDYLEDFNYIVDDGDDILYPANKFIYYTYKGVYRYGLKYVAVAYDSIPSYFQNRIINFTDNASEPINIINHLLQFRINSALESVFRFVVNSTVGFFGVWDVMSAVGLSQKENDFGATMYFYGVPDGPVFFLLGPRNIRDTLGTISSIFIPTNYIVDSNYLQQIQLSYNNLDYISISPKNTVPVIIYANVYRENEEQLSLFFDEYYLIKTLAQKEREKELQEISSYD